MRDIERVIFYADILEIPDILDFSASVVFLDDQDNLDALLSRLVCLVADRIVTIGTIETIVFFDFEVERTLEPSVQTKRDKKEMKVEIMGFN